VEGTITGESWEQTAARGLQEELQMTARELLDVGEFHPDPGGLEQSYHLFIARGLSAIDPEAHVEHVEHEKLEKQAFTRAEIDELISSGEICDNWTLAGLYLLDRYLAGR